MYGLHELHDPPDLSLWQVIKTLARFPNAGCRDAREKHWASIGPNATWISREPLGDRGHQIVVNATKAVPKTTTNFLDYYVYGVGGDCANQGYDPPGGWMCSKYGNVPIANFMSHLIAESRSSISPTSNCRWTTPRTAPLCACFGQGAPLGVGFRHG